MGRSGAGSATTSAASGSATTSAASEPATTHAAQRTGIATIFAVASSAGGEALTGTAASVVSFANAFCNPSTLRKFQSRTDAKFGIHCILFLRLFERNLSVCCTMMTRTINFYDA